MTGQELKHWREARGLTQRDIAAKLDISDAAVNRWENGQDIPGPARLLLKMLINGEMPFAGIGPQKDTEKEAKNFWELQLTLEDWHFLEGMAANAGYADTKDYLLSLIQAHLKEQREGVAGADDSLDEAERIAKKIGARTTHVHTSGGPVTLITGGAGYEPSSIAAEETGASLDATMKESLKTAAVAFVKKQARGAGPESAPPVPGSAPGSSGKGAPRAKPAGKP